MLGDDLITEKITEVLRVHVSSLSGIDDAQVYVKKKKNFLANVSRDSVSFEGSQNNFVIRLRLVKNFKAVMSTENNLEMNQLGAFVKKCYQKFSEPEQIVDFPEGRMTNNFEFIDLKKPLIQYDESLFLIDHEEKVNRLKNLLKKVHQYIGVKNDFFRVSSRYVEEFSYKTLWSLHLPSLLSDQRTFIKTSLNIASNEVDQEWNKTISKENSYFYRINWSSLFRQSIDGIDLFQKKRISFRDFPISPFAELSHIVGQTLLRLFFEHLKYSSKNPQSSFESCELPDEDFSSILQIIDDPFLNQRPYSKFWDSEGHPTERVLFVREGKLCHLPHNTLTASRWGGESTGHAFWNEANELDLRCHNLYIDPGRRSSGGTENYDPNEGRIFFDHFVGPLSFDPQSGYLKTKVVAQYKKSSVERVYFDRAVEMEVNLLELFKSVIRTGRELLWNERYGSPSIVIDLKKAGLIFKNEL